MICKFIALVKKTYNLKSFLPVNLLFFFLIVFGPNAKGQAQTKGGKIQNVTAVKPVTGETYAIIFGISNYPGLTPLKYADKDAALFRDFLESPAGGNTKPENIFYRINENAKGTEFEIMAYRWLLGNQRTDFGKNLKEGDRLYIYFSGHGDAMNEDNYYLLPYDCMPSNDGNNYGATGHIEMYHVKTQIIKPLTKKKVEVLLIVDACRTNDLPGGQQGQLNFVNDVQSIAERKEGEIIMLSTGAGQSAIEGPKIGGGHGLFTWYLVSGLSGDADNDGDAADHDGKVSLAEITSYVKNKVRKEAKTVYSTDQVPVFLSPDRDLETMADVDSGTYANWKLVENMRQQTNGNSNILAVAKKSVAAGAIADTALIELDNKFIAAIKAGKLSGQNSAEAFYNKMSEKWPAHSITQDAKYTLATEFINFGQDKINLFLSGKGIVHIQQMENEFNTAKKGAANKNVPTGISEQIEKMKTLTVTGYDKAANMMEKAVVLLKDDPELLDDIYPKLYFLKAASYDKVNNISGKRQGIVLLKKAIKKDSTAAYNYLMLGHLLYDLKNDSCESYFKKANSLAPKWADPENDIANYYSEKKEFKLAIMHYYAAVKLDSLDALAVQNIGVLYSNENKLDSARKYFLKGLAINPCDRYANCNMGTLSVRNMIHNSATDPNFKIAEKYVKKSMECDSSFTRAYLVLAGLFDRVKLPDSALYYINKGIAANPNDGSLVRMLGDEYFDQKDTLKSEMAYQKSMQIDSMDVINYSDLMWLYENAGTYGNKALNVKKNDFTKAILYSQKALKVDPSFAYAYNTLGNINVDLYQYDQAIPNYQHAIKIDSTYVDAINGLGNAYYYQRDYSKAVSTYKKAINLNPKFAYGYFNLGNVYYNQKDYNNALSNYRKAAELDPAYVNAHQRIGNTLVYLGSYRKAIVSYQTALNLSPNNAAIYNAFGNVYYNLKSYDTSIVYHKKAIALEPTNAFYYNDLGVSYEALSKNDDAITYYKKSIEIDSTHVLPYLDLGYIYKKTKAYNEAIVYYKKALKRLPGNAYINNSLADVYKDLKDYKNQIYYYRKGLEIDSTQNGHLQDLGFAYIYSGKYPDGIALLQKVAKLYPNDNASYYNLACGFSLSNDTNTGMKYLKDALDKGFKDYAWLNQDEDISNLRKQPEFAALMKQYFPDKAK